MLGTEWGRVGNLLWPFQLSSSLGRQWADSIAFSFYSCSCHHVIQISALSCSGPRACATGLGQPHRSGLAPHLLPEVLPKGLPGTMPLIASLWRIPPPSSLQGVLWTLSSLFRGGLSVSSFWPCHLVISLEGSHSFTWPFVHVLCEHLLTVSHVTNPVLEPRDIGIKAFCMRLLPRTYC